MRKGDSISCQKIFTHYYNPPAMTADNCLTKKIYLSKKFNKTIKEFIVFYSFYVKTHI